MKTVLEKLDTENIDEIVGSITDDFDEIDPVVNAEDDFEEFTPAE